MVFKRLLTVIGNVADDFLHHSTHSAHSGGSCGCGVLFFLIGDYAFGGEEHACDGSGVLQCHTGNLCGVDDTGSHEVFEEVYTGVVTEVAFPFFHFLNHNGTFNACVGNNLAERFLNGAEHDVDTCGLIFVGSDEAFGVADGTDVGHTAAGDDAFGDGSACCA